jgi:hypothetical protein
VRDIILKQDTNNKPLDLHKREYTVAEVRRLLTACDFEVEKVAASIQGWAHSYTYCISRFLAALRSSLGHTIL